MKTEILERVPVGRRVVVFEQFSDGLLQLQREIFTPYKSTPENLQDIWSTNAPFDLSHFIHEVTRDGVAYVDETTGGLVWPGQGVTVRACLEVLSEYGAIRTSLTSEHQFKAFAGTFLLPRIKDARSIRRRPDEHSMSAQAYRKKLKEFKAYLIRLLFP